jgi:hypothetical protein
MTPTLHLKELRKLDKLLRGISPYNERALMYFGMITEQVRTSKPSEYLKLKAWLSDPRNKLTTLDRAIRLLTDFEMGLENEEGRNCTPYDTCMPDDDED